MKRARSTRTEKTTTVKLSRADILRMLPKDCMPPRARNVSIYVYVPGGGDWSNMELDIDGDTPLCIKWEETEETNE